MTDKELMTSLNLFSVFAFVFLTLSFVNADEEDEQENAITFLGTEAVASKDLDSVIKSYSDSAEVKKMIHYALKNKLASGMANSKGKCNENVVKAVAAGGLPAWTGTTAYYAYQVSEAAPKLGYSDLLEKFPAMTSKEAPRGAILVYSSNSKASCKTPKGIGCGHVEIKAENGYSESSDKIYFISDYSEYRPVDIDSRYKLIAIFIYRN